MNRHYTIEKTDKKQKIMGLNIDILKGFEVMPKNEITYPGVEVNSMLVIKPSFIDKLLKKKIKRKLNYYLNYIISIIDNSDEDPDDTPLRHALNDLTRYQEMVKKKYQEYLDDKYIHLLNQKISILERELKNKIVYKNMNFYQPIQEEKKGKSR